MTCREAIARLTNLSSRELSAGEAREAKRHFAACEPCAGYWKSYRTTVRLVALESEASGNASPPEMPKALVRGILAAAKTWSPGFIPRAWHIVNLLSGIAAAPIVAFALR